MSEVERYRRSQGRRTTEALALLAAVPVLDACLLRQDALYTQDCGAPTRGAASTIIGVAMDPGVGGFPATTLVTQLPGVNSNVAAVQTNYDGTRFFQPGHWHGRLKLCANITTLNIACRLTFVPIVGGAAQFRPFIGQPSAIAVQLAYWDARFFSATNNIEREIEFEGFFPEPWAIGISTVEGWADSDRFQLYGTLQLHCPLDDVPAAIDPGLLR